MAFMDGAQLDGPTAMPLPQEVAPGGQVDVCQFLSLPPLITGYIAVIGYCVALVGKRFTAMETIHFMYRLWLITVRAMRRCPQTDLAAAMIGGVIWVDNCQALQNGQYS